MSVSEDGTLTIEPVHRDDAGQFICKGLSIAGSAYAKARLDVRGSVLALLITPVVNQLMTACRFFSVKKCSSYNTSSITLLKHYNFVNSV